MAHKPWHIGGSSFGGPLIPPIGGGSGGPVSGQPNPAGGINNPNIIPMGDWIAQQNLNPVIGDDALPADNSNLPQVQTSDGILIYNVPANLETPTLLDRFHVYLMGKESGKMVDMATLPMDHEHIHYENGRIFIDVLAIIAGTFGRMNGGYTLQFQVMRNYIYVGDLDTELGNSIPLGQVKIVEISKTRMEIRVEGLKNTKNSLEIFHTTQKPGTMPDGVIEPSIVWPVLIRGRARRPDSNRPIENLSTNWQYHTWNLRDARDLKKTKDTVIFRLTAPLNPGFRLGTNIFLLRPLTDIISKDVYLDIPDIITENFIDLRGPNLKLPAVAQKSAGGTDLKSETDLLGTDPSVQQRILDKFVSGSQTIELNTDFRHFNEFVHFSSAQERLKTFKYKLTEIQHYESKSAAVSTDFVGSSESGATGSFWLQDNKNTYDTKRSDIISSFDPYEQFLYYESHSTDVTYESKGPVTHHPATWPKSTTVKVKGNYTQFSVTSSEGTSWYNGQLTSASKYDEQNPSMLRNGIPLFIQTDSDNSEYVRFIDMTGHYFDTIYNQIKAFENMSDRNESVDKGISKDLLYDVAKGLGWELESGFDTSELWRYVLGTDVTGSYTSSADGTLNYINTETDSHEIIEKQMWKRLINNISYLYKTKGTARGIRALIANYGIPKTVLRIQEFGGLVSGRNSERRSIPKFSYALNCSGSSEINMWHKFIDVSEQSLSSVVGGDRMPGMYEFRFNTTVTQSMHLLSAPSTFTHVKSGLGNHWMVYLEHSGSAADWSAPDAISAGSASLYSNYGRLTAIVSAGNGQPATSCSTPWAPMYDDDWWNVSFGVEEFVHWPTTTGQTFTLRTAKMRDQADTLDRLTYSSSVSMGGGSLNAQYNYSWANAGEANNVTPLHFFNSGSQDSASFAKLGHPNIFGGNNLAPYTGSVQEIRQWATHISTDAFHKHTLAPTSIVGDTIESAYNDLLQRLPLGTDKNKYNHNSVIGIPETGSVPNTNNLKSFAGGLNSYATFSGFPNSETYSTHVETYYVDVPFGTAPRPHANKIRIEDNSLRENTLSHKKSYETSSFNSNPLDTEQVSIALSPQDQVDTDIAMQFGGFDLADYIGDPRDEFLPEYKSLKQASVLYFKKYSEAYNVWAFLRLLKSMNMGLFKQVENLLPARADALVGVQIRPNILERAKLKSPGSMSQETMYYTASVGLSGMTFTMDAPQSQVYTSSLHGIDNGVYLNYTAPIHIGVRSSQQRSKRVINSVSSSNTQHSHGFVNTFNEGSQYLLDVFGETTQSGQQQFISSSGFITHAEQYKHNPVFNKDLPGDPPLAPVSGAYTGSAGKVLSHIYPKNVDVQPNYLYSDAQRRLVIDGIKMTSPEFNTNSPDTYDGGPVAEFKLVNPNIAQMSDEGLMEVR